MSGAWDAVGNDTTEKGLRSIFAFSSFGGPLLACVGDSRFAQAYSGTYSGTTSTLEWKPNSASTWIEPLMQGRVRLPVTHNCAVSDAMYSDILATQLTTLAGLSPKPTHCLILAGTNDIGNSVAVATIKTNILLVWSRIAAMRITPVHILDLPRTVASWSAAAATKRNELNAWIQQFGRQYGVVVVDANQLYADPADANGDPLSGYNVSDGIHPTMLGAYQCGVALQSYFNTVPLPTISRPSSRGDLYDATNNVRGNMLTNGLMNGTGGTNTGTGASGNIADSWQNRVLTGATVTAVGSKVTRTDAAGYWQKIVYTCTTAGTFRFDQTATMAGIVAGSVVQAELDVMVESNSLLDYLYLTCFGTGGAGVNVATAMKLTGGDYPWPTLSNVTMRYVTPPLIVETGSTDILFRVEIGIEAGGSATLRFGNAQVRQIPAVAA